MRDTSRHLAGLPVYNLQVHIPNRLPRSDLRDGMPIASQIRSTSPNASSGRIDDLLDDLAPAERAALELACPFDRMAHSCVFSAVISPILEDRGFAARCLYRYDIKQAQGRTSKLLYYLFRDPLLNVDLAIDIPSARRSWRRSVGQTGRDAESWRVKG